MVVGHLTCNMNKPYIESVDSLMGLSNKGSFGGGLRWRLDLVLVIVVVG